MCEWESRRMVNTKYFWVPRICSLRQLSLVFANGRLPSAHAVQQRMDAGALTDVAVEVDDTDRPPPLERRAQRWKSSGVITAEGDYPRYAGLAGCIRQPRRNHLIQLCQ